MRWLLCIALPIVLVCSCATKSGRQVSEKGIVPGISAPETLQLMGETYMAGYSASEHDKASVEYFRSGEKRKSWKKTLTLRLNATGPDSLELVGNMEHSLSEGKASAVRSFKEPNTGGCGIEFTVMAREFVELDVFRFVNRTNGPGTISFQYAERIPSEQLREIGEAKLPAYYADLRSRVVKAVEAVPMPKIEKEAK